MGVETNVYVGPYLEVTKQKGVKVTYTKDCPQKCTKAKNTDKNNYCSICGNLLNIKSEEEEIELEASQFLWDTCGDMADNLFTIGDEHYANLESYIYIPNSKNVGIHLDEDVEVVPISDLEFITSSMKKLQSEYKEEIKLLVAKTNDGDVTGKFGVIKYYS